MFMKRDLKIKYAQTRFKVAWLIFQPLFVVGVFTFFFGYVLGWQAKNIPFPVYVFTGLIIWNLFQGGIQSSANSVFENASLLKNNPIPKIIITLSKISGVLIDALISSLILLIIMLFYHIVPSWHFIFLVVPLLLTCMLSLSIVLLLQSFTIKKNRDLLIAMPHLLNILIWVTPVFFVSDILPDKIKFLIYFNPLAGLVELWRYCLLPATIFDVNYLLVLSLIIPLGLFSFFIYFKRESSFNDFI